MPRYKVVLAHRDGTTTEKECSVLWSADKVNSDEVALACAAETSIAGGRDEHGNLRNPCEGISATLLEPVAS